LADNCHKVNCLKAAMNFQVHKLWHLIILQRKQLSCTILMRRLMTFTHQSVAPSTPRGIEVDHQDREPAEITQTTQILSEHYVKHFKLQC
jgi:hypothetical protein